MRPFREVSSLISFFARLGLRVCIGCLWMPTSVAGRFTPATVLPPLVEISELPLDLVGGATDGAAGLLNALAGLVELLSHKLGLDLVEVATGFSSEAARISGHARGLDGSEDDQQEEHYNHHFLRTYAEHLMLLGLLLGTLVGMGLLVLCAGALLFGKGLPPPRR
jgi:hypothetical protein